MYDSWFTMGLAVMRPALLDAINAAQPAFNFVERIVCEVQPDGKLVALRKGHQTGLLENEPTTNVRRAIVKFAKAFSASAPPIGIYCAGRFSQYARITNFASQLPDKSKFSDIIALANTGYRRALGTDAESTRPEFAAFLGACMLDGALARELKTPTQEQIDIASEFGITADASNREWRISTAFAATDEYMTAANLFMTGDLDPWESISAEQIIFWEDFNEHAIP